MKDKVAFGKAPEKEYRPINSFILHPLHFLLCEQVRQSDAGGSVPPTLSSALTWYIIQREICPTDIDIEETSRFSLDEKEGESSC
jgi:hypothetical protein